MKPRHRTLQLTDMDVGLFVSYELTTEALITKLFRWFTLNKILLGNVMDLREAKTEDVTPLNRFNLNPARRELGPVYTLQVAETDLESSCGSAAVRTLK